MSEEELGLRERKKRATRNALQNAALELVVAHGLDNVTVEMITCEVGVSARTFFNYFATKEDSLLDFSPERLERYLADLAARPLDEPPLLSLRTVLMADAPRLEASKDTWRLRLELSGKHPEIFHAAASASARVDHAVTQAIAGRLGHDPATDPMPRLVAGVASAARRTALGVWAHGGFVRPYPEVLAECFDELTHLLPTAN